MITISEKMLLLYPEYRKFYLLRKKLYDILNWDYSTLFIKDLMDAEILKKDFYYCQIRQTLLKGYNDTIDFELFNNPRPSINFSYLYDQYELHNNFVFIFENDTFNSSFVKKVKNTTVDYYDNNNSTILVVASLCKPTEFTRNEENKIFEFLRTSSLNILK